MQKNTNKGTLYVRVLGLTSICESLELYLHKNLPLLQLNLKFVFFTEANNVALNSNESNIVVLCSSQIDITNIPTCKIIPVIFDKNEVLHKSSRHINAFLYDKKNKEKSNELLCNVILERFGLIKNTKNVFISYKRDSSLTLAEDLRKKLMAEGYTVFLDKKNIEIGVDFMDKIKYAIADADVFILLDSWEYFESVYTKKEMYAACLARVPVVMLSTTPKEEKETYGFEFYKIQSRLSISLEEINELTNKIKRLQEKSQIFRIQKLNRVYGCIKGEKDIQLTSLYIPKENELHYYLIQAIFGVPRTTDIERIQKEMNCSCKHIAAVYDDLCLPKSYYEHIEWLNHELSDITLLKMSNIQEEISNKLKHKEIVESKTGMSKKPCVFLSASVPNVNDKKYNFLKIHDIVVSLTSEIIRRGGTLVFGGHPTITPIIQNVMEIMNTNRRKDDKEDYPDIRLYQSKYFAEKYPLEVKLFPRDLLKETKVVEVLDDDKEKTKSRNASLQFMRECMIYKDNIKYTSAIFLGGKYKDLPEKSGVWKEFQMFRKYHENARCIFMDETGVVPELLKDKYHLKNTQIENLHDLL